MGQETDLFHQFLCWRATGRDVEYQFLDRRFEFLRGLRSRVQFFREEGLKNSNLYENLYEKLKFIFLILG